MVRVYVVRGLELQALDDTGRSDPYVCLSLGGKKVVNDKDNYIPQTLNPLFGRFFEVPATLPRDSTLTVSIFDWE